MSVSALTDDRPKALILTAIPDEIDAVVKHLRDLREYVHPRTRMVFDCGLFEGGALTWCVAVAECGAGNVSAGIFNYGAIDLFDPDVVMFVGVAGGLKDVAIGDVVASAKIYGFHSGKAGERFQTRAQLEWPDLSLEQRARAVRRREKWIDRIIPSQTNKPPKAFVGPIAAGENVVASDKSEVFLFLREQYSDSIAVEMEGYGFLAAARFAGSAAIVIRGISDLCEGKSAADEKGSQPRAAAHAAAFAFEILASHTPPPRLKVMHEAVYIWGDVEAVVEEYQFSSSNPTNVLPNDSPKLPDILEGVARLSASLLHRISNAENWIPRSEENQLLQFVSNEPGRVLCLLGAPGSGKTWLLAKVAATAAKAGHVAFSVKADLVPADVPFESWIFDRLGVGLSAIQAITTVAMQHRVVVVIDQLDALAGMVDLTSSRLNNVLSFIDACIRIPQVTVVCSCREFEYRHDTRLAAMNAECVKLELPTWDKVSAEIKNRGLQTAETWPISFREILRTPQHLNVYLERMRETGDVGGFSSYQTMLDDLWEREITTADQRGFVYRLVEQLIKRESLWVPLVQFEADLAVIEQLESKHILVRQDRQLGFMHQTLLEHAKARFFAKSGDSLCMHVLERQDAILVRPTLWAVLRYLRDADREVYHAELANLFAANLRLHIRYLLIDLLGAVNDPDEIEILHMAERLMISEDKQRVLVAIRGNSSWFHAFVRSHFPTVMHWNPADLWPMAGVLISAWEFARAECFGLLEDNWIGNSGVDDLTVRVLREIGHWDQKAVDSICQIIRRSDGDENRLWWAEDLTNIVSADQPTLAPQIFIATVTRSVSTPESRSPLESTNSWYELPAVAGAAPKEFLRAAWPWFAATLEKAHSGGYSSTYYQYEGRLGGLDLVEYQHPPSILAAITIAAEKTAQSDPKEFLEITKSSWSIESLPLHRVIARCFTATPDLAYEGLAYLRADRRRFRLGSHGDGHQGDTTDLIASIAPHLDPVRRRDLEQEILSSSEYRDNVEISADRTTWDRGARLRLLKAIPDELTSPEVAMFVKQEEAALPDWQIHRTSFRGGFIREVPPLTKDQLFVASDEAILETLQPNQSNNEAYLLTDYVTNERPGGARAAARELALLAKDHPERVVTLLPQLVLAEHEYACAEAVRGLVDSELSASDAINISRALIELHPESEELRSNIGYLLYKRCQINIGLPDDLCQVLEKWLRQTWQAEGSWSNDLEVADRDEVDSILWGYSGGVFEMDNAFMPLLALTNGYLMRSPANSTSWLEALNRLLDGNLGKRTWAHFSRELRWIQLNGCNRQLGVAVVHKLFERHPEIACCREGIRLVADLCDLLPSEFLQLFLVNLRDSSIPRQEQAFGELLTMVALHRSSEIWAKDLLDESGDGVESIRIGIAFAAAHLWDDSALRGGVCQILCKLIPRATPKIAQAISTVFWAVNDFAADELTDTLLKEVGKSDFMLTGRCVPDLVEHLAKLLPHLRTTVLEVCRGIVAKRGNELTSLSNELFSSGPHLVDIAMTLQRFSNTRADGLSLLESLLRLGLDDAFAILNDIDIRPAAAARREPRRRRRRQVT